MPRVQRSRKEGTKCKIMSGLLSGTSCRRCALLLFLSNLPLLQP